jgi:hypothetical protein
MDEQSLKLALEEVSCNENKTQCLQLRWRSVCLVDIRAEKINKRVDEKGSEVFDDKDCAPRNLRAW